MDPRHLRIEVHGVSGSGKSALALIIAEHLGVRLVQDEAPRFDVSTAWEVVDRKHLTIHTVQERKG